MEAQARIVTRGQLADSRLIEREFWPSLFQVVALWLEMFRVNSGSVESFWEESPRISGLFRLLQKPRWTGRSQPYAVSLREMHHAGQRVPAAGACRKWLRLLWGRC